MTVLAPVSLPRWTLRALMELRVSEVPGKGSNDRILEYLKYTTDQGAPKVPSDDATPWCAAYMNWCLGKEGLPTSKSHAAKSFSNYGQSLPSPVPGAILVFNRAGANAPSWQGHTAQFLCKDRTRPHMWRVVGANQNDRCSIALWDSRLLIPNGIRYPTGQIVVANEPYYFPLTDVASVVSDR